MKIKYTKPVTLGLFLLPLMISLISIGIGRYAVSMVESLSILMQSITGIKEGTSAQAYSVIMNMRLPRLMLALLCGMGLSAAGAAFQALFSNPLTSPDTLGVSAGASFGAALALLVGMNLVIVQIWALIFGLVAVGVAFFISQTKGKPSIVMMVLGGLVVTYMFQAFVSLIKYVADTDSKLPTITYWLMGSLTGATYKSLLIGSPLIIVGCLIIFALRWKLNILSLSEEESKSMGINVSGLRISIILAATASCVSMCGVVGWVGLLIPHIARMFFGNNNSYVVPVSMSLGASFLVIMDTIARTATAAEIPISILTALIGAPFFIILLKRTGGRWN